MIEENFACEKDPVTLKSFCYDSRPLSFELKHVPEEDLMYNILFNKKLN
jgi:hypothetical protein